jgi:hypothetical protein
MDWFKGNWKKLLKWSGLGAGCLVVALGGFVFARWLESGSEYEGELLDLAPTDVAVVMTVDNVPNRKGEFERFLDDMIQQPGLAQLERSSLWQDSVGKSFGDSLEQFRNEKYEQNLKEARRSSDELGIELFKDVLSDELVICTDPGENGTDLLMLSRLARGARFKWEFLDIASGFFPEGPNQPKLEYTGGILKVTPAAQPDQPTPRAMLIAVLDDVLLISNSSRLINGAISLHGSGKKGMSADKRYQHARSLVDPATAERHLSGVYIDLDRLRERLPAKTTDDGRQVSPVDAYTSLPTSVIAIYPDIFGPVNRIVSQDLDTRPFHAAYYGVDLTEPGVVTFDQYLLVDEDRIAADEFKHLRETWAAPAAKETQLEFLPPDTMLQISYRQPMDVLYNDVLDDSARGSLVGDFIVAMNGPGMAPYMPNQAEELVFAAVPRTYAPNAAMPLSGTDMPLPGFVIAFRTPGADPQIARALLEEYLQAQRGRSNKPGEEPKKGAVTVVQKDVPGMQVYGFEDPREEDNFIRRLNLSIRATLIGEWLVLTNSETLLRAISTAGSTQSLAGAPGSAWRSMSTTGHATIYLDFDLFADYAGSRELFKVLRDNKYNPTLPEGRDPGELRREIAQSLGYDPHDTASLTKQDVTSEYNRRKTIWEQKCQVEGDRYIAELQADMNGLRYFKDLALTTNFAEDHLHVHGLLRMGD